MNTPIEKIESLLAHQDQQIQDLSEMVNAQWKEIERLKRALTRTGDKLQTLEERLDSPSSQSSHSDERPPHY